MPTYDYECEACGHTFERFQPITSRAIRKCPQCGKRAVRRLIGRGAGVIFKGSGFYQTDYRSDAYKKAAEKDKNAAGGGGTDKKGASKASGKSASDDGGAKAPASTESPAKKSD